MDRASPMTNVEAGQFPFGLDGAGDQLYHSHRSQLSSRNGHAVVEPSGENDKAIAELLAPDLAALGDSDRIFTESPNSEMETTQRGLLKGESTVNDTNSQSNQNDKEKRGPLAKRELSGLLPPPHQPSMKVDNSLGSSFTY